MDTKSKILAQNIKRFKFYGPKKGEIFEKRDFSRKKRNSHCDPVFCPNYTKLAGQLGFAIIFLCQLKKIPVFEKNTRSH